MNTFTPDQLIVHVFHDLIDSSFDIEILKSWVISKGGHIQLHSFSFEEVSAYISEHVPVRPHFRRTSHNYVRYIMAARMPGVKSVLYLDSDIVIQRDIVAFMNSLESSELTIRAFSIPASSADVRSWEQIKSYGVDVDSLEPSFNAGILIVDLYKWHSQNISTQLKKICTINHEIKLWTRFDSQLPLQLLFGGDRFYQLNLTMLESALGDDVVTRPDRILSRDAVFLQWNGKYKPWMTNGRFTQYWLKYAEGINAKYLFLSPLVLFIGFTAPRPEDSAHFFNGGTGKDWIARLPQHVSVYSNATVYVCEAGRIIKERLRKGDAFIHKLIPKALNTAECDSVRVLEADARQLQFDLVVVRQIAEVGLYRRVWGDTPPKLTAIFPLQYKNTKSNCAFYGDVCIPDNFLFKGLDDTTAALCLRAMNTYNSMTNKKVILYPAKIYPRKGQLEFINSVSAESLRIFIIRFIGPERDTVYYETLKDSCKDKNLSCEFWGSIPHSQILEQFRSAFGVISFGVGEVDPNPRIVGEALSCGLPVLVGPLTVVSEMVEDNFPYIGQRITNNSDASKVFKNWSERDYSDKPLSFFRKYGSEKEVFERLFRNIYDNSSWRTNWKRLYLD
jgi:lipopolysaccharide biosynthesis glycosyltransferase